MPPEYVYFKPEEVKGLDPDLCADLDMGRAFSGVPYSITRGLDTPEHNATLPNAVSDSAHLTGHAVDLACADSFSRYKILIGLIKAGFKRIGIYEKHLHADNDITKPQGVIWYTEGN